MPPQDKGTITITDDDLMPVAPPVTTPPAVMPPAEPGWWDRVNKGHVSPDTFLRWATGGQMKSVADLEKETETTPRKGETPGQAYSRVFHSGLTADLAKTASSATSDIAIATAGLSQVAKLPTLAGKTARAILAMQGLGYGAAGGVEAMEGVQKGASTPEGMQKILSGSSQMAAAAPALAEAGRVGVGALAKVAPQFFAKGEGAFVSALAPSAKNTPRLREAYRARAADLKTAPVKDLADLYVYSEIKRVEAAQELNREMGRIAPQQTIIDHYAVSDAIRNRVTRTLAASSPQEAKVILDFADRIKQDYFNHPVDLATAESIVQELNKKSTAFDRMTEAQQRQRLAQGDPILGEKALKHALQEQIEAKLTNYHDLKNRYGSWKEIQDQTQNRIDEIERKGGKASYVQRRALESLLSAGGVLFGLMHGGGAEGFVGGAGGYLLGRFAADQIITRLEDPSNALERGMRPAPAQRPLPFAGMIAQPVAAGQGGDDTDKILDQMFGAKK